jgi:hypothetical protein
MGREAQTRGINDEAGLITLAGEKGVSAADAKAALDGWVARMGQMKEAATTPTSACGCRDTCSSPTLRACRRPRS